MQRYSSWILDEILNQALKSYGTSISFKELQHGAVNEEESLIRYLNKLVDENYISRIGLNKNDIQISLTERGRTFIQNGGYNKPN